MSESTELIPVTFTVNACVNWKEKSIGRKAQPRDTDDDGMEGWAVVFDPPEKKVRQTRCRHEGIYKGDMSGWAQHNYTM